MAVAETLDFPASDVGAADDGSVEAAVGLAVERLRDLPTGVGAAKARWAIQRLEMAETEMVARARDNGASRDGARKAAGAGGDRSKRDADKVAKRADACRANPALSDEVNQGNLSTGQLDAIAEGAARTDGDAARDPELIDQVKKTQNPDQARQAVRDWEDARSEQDELDEQHRRHRAKRGVRRYVTKRGTSAIVLEGDKTSIDEIDTAIAALADRFYRADGGRDVPASKHPRTGNQRLFDAAHTLICVDRPTVDGTADTAATPSPTPPSPARRVPVLHVCAGVDDLFGPGTNPAILLGSGPLPTPELERFACSADLVGTIFSGEGEVLWQGRRVRVATPAQWDALIARDRGCVLCGASPGQCEAHHLRPFEAQVRGPTDIDQLALACGGCHRHLHNCALTLERAPDGTWRTRPATPDERAPKRRT